MNKKKRVIKRELLFENFKDCLFNGQVILKSQHRFKSDHHKVYTEAVNNIALNSDDDKRLQTFDRITTYPYGKTNEMPKVFEATEALKMYMISFEDYVNENKTEHNKNRP